MVGDQRVRRVGVEHRERGVQVVVARVDQLERDDLAAGERGELAVRGGVGAEAGAGEDDVADDEHVALALVDLLRRCG